MWITKQFSPVAFLISCVLGTFLSSCTIVPEFLKTAGPENRENAVYKVLEKNVPLTARRYVGMPYQWGADPDTLNRTDCSHLVSAIVRNSLSGSPFRMQATYFTTDSIKEQTSPIREFDVRVGDIVFFRNEGDGSDSNHAGIVIRKQGSTIFFIQASSSKGVIETSTVSESWMEYWQERLHSYRRWKKSVFVQM